MWKPMYIFIWIYYFKLHNSTAKYYTICVMCFHVGGYCFSINLAQYNTIKLSPVASDLLLWVCFFFQICICSIDPFLFSGPWRCMAANVRNSKTNRELRVLIFYKHKKVTKFEGVQGYLFSKPASCNILLPASPYQWHLPKC